MRCENRPLHLTKRDMDVMRWINGFGFVTMDLIATYWGRAIPTAYGRIHKLVAAGYLIHQRIFHSRAGIYTVSLSGVHVSGSSLPPLRRVNLATYRHDLLVARLSIALVEHYGGRYIPERVLRQESGQERFAQSGHFCDGVLVLPDQQIAIEVELSKKGKRRREKILREYFKKFDYEEVWYFCGHSEVEAQLKPFTETLDFLKLHRIKDYLPKTYSGST